MTEINDDHETGDAGPSSQGRDRTAAGGAPPPAAAPPRGRWQSAIAALPGIGVALVPKAVCPLCWPAYAAVLSATGLTFLLQDRWLLPISGLLLGGALLALAWRAKSRRGYRPVGAAAGAALLILTGKFALGSAAVMYAGVAALFAACVWNAWPRRTATTGCPACRQSTTATNHTMRRTRA